MNESELERAVSKSRVNAGVAHEMRTELPKSKVITLRVEEPLFRAIEAQAKVWHEKPAETMRTILRFYFLPVALEFEGEELSKLWRNNFTPEDAASYYEFAFESLGKVGNFQRFLNKELLNIKEAMESKLSKVNEALEEKKEAET